MVEMIAAMECKTEEAWVGSGRVGSGERLSLPNSTQASLFFRSAVAIAPFTVHFVLLAHRLKQAMLSLDRLSIKASFFSFFSEGTVTNPAV